MKYTKDNPLTVIELFAGYGSQAISLERLKCDFPPFDYNVLAISEIEPSALKAYQAIHGHCPNLGDVSKIDWSAHPELKGVGLATYSFPCTDISNAGKQEGFAEGSGTRSSLLWECQRCFETLKPKYLLMENVKALVQKKFMSEFQRWLDYLDSIGYTTYWQVINAKDMSIPQNRERVFAVSILRTEDEPTPTYSFPAKIPLTKCVEDYMVPAEEMDESYFISQDRVTNKVLSDILDQPNVRAEMEKLYHEEWGKMQPTTELTYHFVSLEWLRREDCWENLGDHFQVYKAVFSTADGLREEEIKVSIWYHAPNMYRDDIRKAIQRFTYGGIDNIEELEDAIYQDLVTNSH